MLLHVTRTRQGDTDRRGNPKNVRFTLQFKLQLDEAEADVVRSNALDGHVLFNSPARIVHVREVLQEGAEWTLPSLDTALSIQSSMVENCRSFDALVRAAARFQGTEAIELARV